jgi:ribonuclease BN (tRNA processing enzyme)
MSTIIVFSHLRWDFVFQRPQHLLTRLAQSYKILFVEEPVHHEGETFMKTSQPAPNVTVCRAAYTDPWRSASTTTRSRCCSRWWRNW